jgi:hypothetical protein
MEYARNSNTDGGSTNTTEYWNTKTDEGTRTQKRTERQLQKDGRKDRLATP